MTRPLRVAVVGAGLAAQSHALDIVTDGALDLAGFVATTPQSAAAKADVSGGTAYQNLEAMLGDKSVDAVVIAVPPRAAFEVLKLVTKTGRPCLAEKPVATSKDSLLFLERLMQSNAPVVAPFNRRYQFHVRQARAVLAAGDIGEVTGVEATWQGPYRDRFDPGGGTYRASARAREGVLLDSGGHALDAISLLLGGIADTQVTAVAVSCNSRGAEVEGEVSFTAGPVSVSLHVTDVPQAPSCGGWRIRVRGTDGAMTLDDQGYAIDDRNGRERLRMPAAEMERPVSDLRRLSHGDEPLGTGLGEVRDFSGLAIAIYDAASAGRVPWQRPRGKALGRLNGAC